MKKEEGLGRRQTTKCSAKRPARTCPVNHATTVLSCFDKIPSIWPRLNLFGICRGHGEARTMIFLRRVVLHKLASWRTGTTNHHCSDRFWGLCTSGISDTWEFRGTNDSDCENRFGFLVSPLGRCESMATGARCVKLIEKRYAKTYDRRRDTSGLLRYDLFPSSHIHLRHEVW